jgi:hypothetical protein
MKSKENKKCKIEYIYVLLKEQKIRFRTNTQRKIIKWNETHLERAQRSHWWTEINKGLEYLRELALFSIAILILDFSPDVISKVFRYNCQVMRIQA